VTAKQGDPLLLTEANPNVWGLQLQVLNNGKTAGHVHKSSCIKRPFSLVHRQPSIAATWDSDISADYPNMGSRRCVDYEVAMTSKISRQIGPCNRIGSSPAIATDEDVTFGGKHSLNGKRLKWVLEWILPEVHFASLT